ncbi:MAG: TIM barrel protein [Balneolaceae bacterium]|nr:TIM barrel protein [Balneolaceae bacterium]
MKRRQFISKLVYGSAGIGLTGWLPAAHQRHLQSADPFSLNYAPHFGLFDSMAGSDLTDQLRFIADQGFRSLEDNTMRSRPVSEQKKIAREMQRLELQMGVFVAHTIGWDTPNLTSGDGVKHQQFLKEIESSVELAKRVNATWMTVVPGRRDRRLAFEYQTANVIEILKRASAILEPHRLVMVLEPLNTLHDHPGQFLTEIPQAYEICKAVDSPSCKILFDIYHQQITEGNLTPNIDYAWDEIAYFQVGDHPGRNEPTTGEINYPFIFQHLMDKGYDGIIGMEHGVSGQGVDGEEALIEAYRFCDPQ